MHCQKNFVKYLCKEKCDGKDDDNQNKYNRIYIENIINK